MSENDVKAMELYPLTGYKDDNSISDNNYNPVAKATLYAVNMSEPEKRKPRSSSKKQSLVGAKQPLETDLDKVAIENSNAETSAPIDKWQLVYIIFIIHGIGTLMPWNMFINANDYFSNYKLTTVTGNGTRVPSVYKEYFLSYLGIASNVPNVIFSLLNIFAQFGGEKFTARIVTSIAVELTVFLFTVILAIVNTQDWVSGFFYCTMASVVVINMANAIYQNSLYGLASAFPMRYTNAIVLGNNISGTYTSIINIISIAVAPDLRTAAVVYFVSALVVLIVCLNSYLAFPTIKFYRHYTQTKKNEKTNVQDGVIEQPKSKKEEYLEAFKYCWKQCLNVFLVFFVSLAVFPVVMANTMPIDTQLFGSTEATEKYFAPVTCFLVFNLFAMMGNIIPNYIRTPGPDRLWIPVTMRLLFIPFFLMCNFNPSLRAYPVPIQSDWIYILGGILLGVSSGYYSSLAMMYASSTCPSHVAGKAGMMAGACLVIGVFFGVNFSFALTWFMKQKL